MVSTEAVTFCGGVSGRAVRSEIESNTDDVAVLLPNSDAALELRCDFEGEDDLIGGGASTVLGIE